MPHALASEVPGIHNQPPDRAVVPPNLGSFSMINTLSPCAAALTAALIPDAPEPITRTSHSYASSAVIFDILLTDGRARSAPRWLRRPRGFRPGRWRSPR